MPGGPGGDPGISANVLNLTQETLVDRLPIVIIRPAASSSLNLSQEFALNMVAEGKHESWVRWLIASINTHMLAAKGSLPMYLEGDERTLQDEAEFYELRIDGPFITQTQKGCYYLDVEINVLIQAHMDAVRLYNNATAVGPIVKAFTNAICVYKFGDGNFDDQSLFGVLRLNRSLDETVDVNSFGIIQENTRLTHTTVEAHYRMEI